MTSPNTAPLKLTRITRGLGGDLIFESYNATEDSLRLVFVRQADLVDAIAKHEATPIAATIGLDDEPAQEIEVVVEGWFVTTPLGAIAIDAPALLTWLANIDIDDDGVHHLTV